MACASSSSKPHYHWLRKQQKLQAQHGPIELVIQIEGDLRERSAAFEQAVALFDTVLDSLVSELTTLRSPVSQLNEQALQGTISRRMFDAVKPFSRSFVTPMASVAGSVAQSVLSALCCNRTLSRACVNNGGDIALYLNDNTQYSVGICSDLKTAKHNARAIINSGSTVRGIATSGWQGRSHSLGIADAVTVLSHSAAIADVAATLIANHITLPGSRKIHSLAANELFPDSDLGERAVTVAVDDLSATERYQALLAGQRYALTLCEEGLIDSAYLSLQGESSVVTQKQTRHANKKITAHAKQKVTQQAGRQAFNHWRDSA